jgi:hypothetical protein
MMMLGIGGKSSGSVNSRSKAYENSVFFTLGVVDPHLVEMRIRKPGILGQYGNRFRDFEAIFKS